MKLIALALFVTLPAFAADQSYPLKCRGGKIETLGYEFSPTTAQLNFKKADKAAPQGLNPGECSWMDRALAASEPSVIVMHPVAPKNFYGTTSIRFGYAPGAAGPVQTVNPIIGVKDPELGWMKSLLTNDSYWMFKVYNDRTGHFIATDSQPSEP